MAWGGRFAVEDVEEVLFLLLLKLRVRGLAEELAREGRGGRGGTTRPPWKA